MRTIARLAAVMALALTLPTLSLAAGVQGSTPPAKPAAQAAKPAPAKATADMHSTSGVVKSIDATHLVITKPTGTVKELSFVLNSATQRTGDLAAGATVDVRYKAEGKQNIATAVTVHTKK